MRPREARALFFPWADRGQSRIAIRQSTGQNLRSQTMKLVAIQRDGAVGELSVPLPDLARPVIDKTMRMYLSAGWEFPWIGFPRLGGGKVLGLVSQPDLSSEALAKEEEPAEETGRGNLSRNNSVGIHHGFHG